MGEIRI